MKLILLACVGTLFSAVFGAPLKKRDSDLDAGRCSDFCAGTNSSSDNPSLYVCGDPRLGPAALPSGLPLDGIAGPDSTYRRFGGLCPGQFLATWTNPSTGEFNYPPLNGYVITTEGQPSISNFTLSVGTFLDRFGSEYGNFMSPAGAPYSQRALPPTNLDSEPGAAYPNNYRVYVVSRSFNVQGGPIAGWFGQQGMGVQFLVPMPVYQLVEQGYVSRINLTADPLW